MSKLWISAFFESNINKFVSPVFLGTKRIRRGDSTKISAISGLPIETFETLLSIRKTDVLFKATRSGSPAQEGRLIKGRMSNAITTEHNLVAVSSLISTNPILLK